MNIDWRSAAIGVVVFWVLALVTGFAGGLSGFGNVAAALIGGFVGVWMSKSKDVTSAATLGGVSGVIGGVIAYIVAFVYPSGYGGWMYSTGIPVVDWVLWGLIFAAIGGAISSYVR